MTNWEKDTIAAADVLMALDLPPGIRDWAPRLRWVQAIGAGIGQLEPAKLKAKGIALTNAAGVASAPIAEFAIGRLLEVWKDIRVLERQQKDHHWEMHQGLLVKGKTIGIVGLGAIGRDVARRAKAFETTVLGNRRSAQPGDTDPDVDELYGLDGLDEMLARCDAVVLSAPHTPETIDLFDAERLGRLKPGGGGGERGPGVDHRRGRLGGRAGVGPSGRRGAGRDPRGAAARRQPPVGCSQHVPVAPLLHRPRGLQRSADGVVLRQSGTLFGQRAASQRGRPRPGILRTGRKRCLQMPTTPLLLL